MELELGLKITHTRDDADITSMADLRIIKDPSGPVFVSKETETKFILIAHLTGFRREDIDIAINEDGSRIAISGTKAVQEVVLKGWIVQKKEMEIRTFRRVFGIPDGVILDKIKAKFKDEDSELTIFMPKVVKGFCGVGIEEVKEEEIGTDDEKEIWKSEETDQIAETEKPIVAQVPEKPKEETVEEKIEGSQDSARVEERAIDGGPQMVEEFPGRDDDKETMKENPEESRELETAAESIEWSIQEESKKPEVESREANDQVAEKSKGRPEIELQASVEKVEPQVMTEKFQETASLKPEEQAEREPIQTEETQREKLPEEKAQELRSEKHDYGPEISKSTESGDDKVPEQLESPSSSSTRDEEKHTTSEDHQKESENPVELQKQEPSTEIQELTKPEEPHPEQETEVTQSTEIEEDRNGEENQPQEKPDEHDSHELEKQRGLSEAEAAQRKKNASKKNKVCPPLVVAGSALLVSLIVFVFHLIRSKKR